MDNAEREMGISSVALPPFDKKPGTMTNTNSGK